DINTQFTATTSSPVPFDLYDDDEYDKNSKPFEIYKDENNEDSQPFEVYKDENNEDSQPFEVYKDENEDDYKPFEVYRDEDDSKSCTINTINNNKPFTCIREDNKENEPLSIDNNENDALSEDLDSDINIPQTKDTAVALKSNKKTKSFDDFSFFGEVDDEGSNTNSTYFDLEKERENGEQGNNFDVFTDLDGDFSVGELASTDEAFSICIDTKNKDSLQDYTLSPEIQTLSQVHVPLPNPRGKDILEKLNIKSINDSKQKLEVDNEDDVDDDDDDGLPLFN
ncbi:uncharacterized protein BX663DRAFT_510593, partial [Cokeromyces recurvatus]|uniref:uncharacterized protein n=1 Tax=Cokeromyces recurvatus TaxID=90255 RepID=UPI0022211569